MKKQLGFLIAITLLFTSCNEEDTRTPEQIERDLIMETENLLRNNTWGFYDMMVSVQYEARAIPLLAIVADENGMVQPGIYDSYDIFGNNNRQLNYSYQFSRDKITQDTSGYGEYSQFGGYFVLNTHEIRINPDSMNALRFSYDYDTEYGKFMLHTDQARSKLVSDFINKIVADAILSGNLGDISDAIVSKILDSDKVAELIEQFLYDLIHGKIEEINENPEESAEKIAQIIVNQLKSIDWEPIIASKLQELLEKLQVENPEEKALELAGRIADKIEASISKDDIYEMLLPYFKNFEEETLPVLATKIAEKVYEVIATVLSEENIYEKIYPVWDEFTKVDSSTIAEISDTIATLVTERFFDANELTNKLIPFVTKVDDTPIRNLGDLAQEIIDSVLIPTVDEINDRFPGLELEPDWRNVKTILTAALTTIKTAIGSSTVEEFSAWLANSIINAFDVILGKGFETAIYRLQEIPAEQAATVISSWISSLVETAEENLVEIIETRLNEIFAKFDAEIIADQLAGIIYETIISVLSEENLYKLILPVLEAINKLEMEQVAGVIAKWLIESGIIEDAIDEEVVIEKLTEIITELLLNADSEKLSQKFTELILQSDLVQGVDGKLLSKWLEFKLYELFINLGRNFNAIESIEIELIRK